MRRFARPYVPQYAAGFLLLLATNALTLWIPWLLRDAIRALEAGRGLDAIGGLALGMIGVALAAAVVRTLSRLAILGASRHIAFDIREAFFARLLGLGAAYYDTQRTGDIMSRGVNDVRLVQAFFGPGLLNLMNTGIVYVAVLVLLVRLDLVLTLCSLGIYPLLFLGVRGIGRGIYARSLAVQEQLGRISNRAQENISGIQQVKIHAQEAREAAAFGELCAEYRRLELGMAWMRGAMQSLIGVVSGLATLVVLFIGGRFVIEGRIDFGDFVAFNAYLGLLVWPTIALGWILNTLERGVGAMQRIDEVLDARPEAEPADAGALSPLSGDIEISHLSFAYDGGAVLDDVSLSIPRGSRVAIVGPVGSGKSTLVNLLGRIYPVPPGTIFVDGVDVNAIPLARLRAGIGWVPQESFLFSRSLGENVRFGSPEATDAEVLEAIELAHLAGDLEALPQGLDTRVGERGFTLSGGQRQRAALARALVGRPHILILDDSLSAVDAATERAILDVLLDRRREHTLILVTHRMSALAGMDRVVVLERGRVIEQRSPP
jgi:ATP-binding cassette subfamily B protein